MKFLLHKLKANSLIYAGFTLCVSLSFTLDLQAKEPLPTINWRFKSEAAIWASTLSIATQTFAGDSSGNVYAIDNRTGALLWKIATGGPIFSRPSHSKGQIFISSDDGYLYNLSAKNGKQKWRFHLDPEAKHKRILPTGKSASWDYRASGAVIHDGLVYIGSADGNLYAIDEHSGKARWHYSASAAIRATPSIDEGLIIFGDFNGQISAIRQKDGREIWTKQTGNPIPSTGLIDNGTFLVGGRSAKLYALDATTGEERWVLDYEDGSWIESHPIIDNKVLYIGSSDWQVVLAIDPNSGEILWKTKALDGRAMPAPVIDGNALYQGYMGYSEKSKPEGGLVKLDKRNGDLLWTLPFEDLPHHTGHGVTAQPEIVGEAIIFSSLSGEIYSIKR